MTTKLFVISALFAAILFQSCKKDDPAPVAPTISDVGIVPGSPGATDYVQVNAVISDASGLTSVKLYYKISTQSSYTSIEMTAGANSSYSASIPPYVKGTVVQYYMVAINASNLSTAYPANAPGSILDYTVGDPSIVINEIYPNGNNANPDWVELYNKSNSPINISGYKIYDSGGLNDIKPKMEVPDGTIIPSHGFYIIVVDDSQTANPDGSDFGLTSAGEEIWLESEVGNVIEDITFPAIASETESYGRNPDGAASWQIMTIVTKAAPNTSLRPQISSTIISPENPIPSESVLVSATVTDLEGLESVKLYYNVEGGSFSSINMAPSGNIYSATIPSLPGGSAVGYYIEATDIYSLISYYPATAPVTPSSYTVLGASTITDFMASPSNPTSIETVEISANITDDQVIGSVLLHYKIAGGNYTPVTMSAIGDNYSANIPVQAGGTAISYYIEVTNSLSQKTYAPANGLTIPATYVVTGPIVINELFARGTVGDPDWIELYNLTNAPVDISGYKIYDSGGQSGSKPKMEIPASTTIPANGYYVIVVDVTNAEGSGFGLSNSGEAVWLESLEGTVVDNITFGATAVGQSYGRSADGTSGWMVLSTITNGTANP